MSPLRALRRSRAVAVVLLLAAVPGLPHALDDTLCAPTAGVAVDHDETQHGIRSGALLEQEHCALCHWIRSLRAPRAALAAAGTHISPPTLVDRAAASVHLSPVREGLPARAPPAVLL